MYKNQLCGRRSKIVELSVSAVWASYQQYRKNIIKLIIQTKTNQMKHYYSRPEPINKYDIQY